MPDPPRRIGVQSTRSFQGHHLLSEATLTRVIRCLLELRTFAGESVSATRLVFPLLVTQFSAGQVFEFTCFMMVLHLIWVATIVPETKGVPLEEL